MATNSKSKKTDIKSTLNNVWSDIISIFSYNFKFITFLIFLMVTYQVYYSVKDKDNELIKLDNHTKDSLIYKYQCSIINLTEFIIKNEIMGFTNVDSIDSKFNTLKNNYLQELVSLKTRISKLNEEKFVNANDKLLELLSTYYELNKSQRLDYFEDEESKLDKRMNLENSFSELKNYKDLDEFNFIVKGKINEQRNMISTLLSKCYQN